MSDDFEKYAVYWVPKRADALARFGASWTGRCAEQGERRVRAVISDLSFDAAAITQRARRHGFHAVVKAPFHLGPELSFFALEHVLGLLVEESVAFQLPRLRLAVVDECVALVPSQGSPVLNELVARSGSALGQLSEPANGVTTAQAVASARDGIEVGRGDSVVNFPTSATHRFHMPLTDPISPERALELISKLQPVLEPILQQPRQLNDLALMGDPGEGRPLRVLQRYDLRDWPQRNTSGAMPCQGRSVLVANLNDPMAKSEIAM